MDVAQETESCLVVVVFIEYMDASTFQFAHLVCR